MKDNTVTYVSVAVIVVGILAIGFLVSSHQAGKAYSLPPVVPEGKIYPVNCWYSQNGVQYYAIVDDSYDPAKVFLVGNDGSLLSGVDADSGEDIYASFNLPPTGVLAVRIASGSIAYEELSDCDSESCTRSLCVKRADGTTSVTRVQRSEGSSTTTSTEMFGEDGMLRSREQTESTEGEVVDAYLEEFDNRKPTYAREVHYSARGTVTIEHFFVNGECERVVETTKDANGRVIQVLEKDCNGNILRRTDYSDSGETVTETLLDDEGNIIGYRITMKTEEGVHVETIDAEGNPLQKSVRNTRDMNILGAKVKPIVKFY